MRCRSTLVVVAVAVVSFFASPRSSADLAAAGLVPALQQKAAKPVPMSDASIKAGAVVYAKTCRPCHGLQARGDGIAAPPGSKPANLVDAEWKHGNTDAAIFKNIREGIAPFDVMKPQKGKLTETEIWNVIHYVRNLAQRAAKK